MTDVQYATMSSTCTTSNDKKAPPSLLPITPNWEAEHLPFMNLDQHLPQLQFQWFQIRWFRFAIRNLVKLLMLKSIGCMIPQSWRCPHWRHPPHVLPNRRGEWMGNTALAHIWVSPGPAWHLWKRGSYTSVTHLPAESKAGEALLLCSFFHDGHKGWPSTVELGVFFSSQISAVRLQYAFLQTQAILSPLLSHLLQRPRPYTKVQDLMEPPNRCPGRFFGLIGWKS